MLQVNGSRRQPLPVHSSGRQGCPMSPLYMLYLNMALCTLEADGSLEGFSQLVRRPGGMRWTEPGKIMAHAISLLVGSAYAAWEIFRGFKLGRAHVASMVGRSGGRAVAMASGGLVGRGQVVVGLWCAVYRRRTTRVGGPRSGRVERHQTVGPTCAWRQSGTGACPTPCGRCVGFSTGSPRGEGGGAALAIGPGTPLPAGPLWLGCPLPQRGARLHHALHRGVLRHRVHLGSTGRA